MICPDCGTAVAAGHEPKEGTTHYAVCVCGAELAIRFAARLCYTITVRPKNVLPPPPAVLPDLPET